MDEQTDWQVVSQLVEKKDWQLVSQMDEQM
jgi:hypothetical protein